MKRRKFISSLCLIGGGLGIPSFLSSCRKDDLTFEEKGNKLQSKLSELQNSGQLETKFQQAASTYTTTHDVWDCTAIRIVSHARRTPRSRSRVYKNFGCTRTVDFSVEGTFLKETASNVQLKFPKVQIAGHTYYMNIYDQPVELSLPIGDATIKRRSFDYITKDMLDGSIIIQKI